MADDDAHKVRLPHDRASIIFGVLRILAGIALTTAAAGPIVSLFLFGRLVLYSPVAILILGFSIVPFLSISLPAAIINAAIVSLLARFRVDALPISLVSGGIIGLWARSALHGSARTPVTVDMSMKNPGEFLAFAATGALMGALYWVIAILPQRSLAREAARQTKPDHPVENATISQRDRRIPWDGRAPRG